MAKDAYYFSHDSNAKDDVKCMMLIEELQLEGYGIYWILIETLREQENYKYPLRMIPILARRFYTTKEKMMAVVTNYDLFVIENEEFFYSHSLNYRMGIMNYKREKARLAGKKSGESRRNKAMELNSSSTDDEQTFNSSSTDDEQLKEKKEKEIKDKLKEKENKTNINYLEIKNEWNETGELPEIKVLSNKRKEKIKLRVEENSFEEFKNAISLISKSEFCKGENDRNWKADIDWLIANDTNIIKVLEGKYDNKTDPKSNQRKMTPELKAKIERLKNGS